MELVGNILYIIGLLIFAFAFIFKPTIITRNPEAGIMNKAIRALGVFMVFMAMVYATRWFG